MSGKVLPLLKTPPVIGYQHHAYVLGILLAADNESILWFYNNYIQLEYTPHDRCHFNFYRAPWESLPFFEYEFISKSTLTRHGISIHDYIADKIENGYYIIADLDEFYIPCRIPHNKNHYYHDNLIFGYDRIHENYDIIGFTDDRQYSCTKVDYESLEAALFSNEKSEFGTVPRPIIFALRKKRDYKFAIDIALICDLMSDYLNSGDTSCRYRFYDASSDGRIFGINACRELSSVLENYLTDSREIDIRPFQILWEHKKSMSSRIQYLYSNNFVNDIKDILEGCKCLEKKALAIRNTVLMFEITKNPKIIPGVIAELNSIIIEEMEILKQFLISMKVQN